MTELKPSCPIPNCKGHANHSFTGKHSSSVWCSECGFSIGGVDREILTLIWNNSRPQYITEKVNWAKGKCCSGYPNCIHNPSLNQVSQEDRDGLAKCLYYESARHGNPEYFMQWEDEIDENKKWYLNRADAILKEYVLVRKNEER